MFPPSHSLNGLEHKPTVGAHISTSTEPIRNFESSEFGLQNFSHSSAVQTPLTRPQHTASWMSPNQMSISSKTWQGQPQQWSMENHIDPQKMQKVSHQDDVKHREYLKQQQRLKAMQLSSNKGVSADSLIGDLLEKKDTFTPKTSVPSKLLPDSSEARKSHLQAYSGISSSSNTGAVTNAQAFEDLPVWLNPSSSRVPPMYSHIWSLVSDTSSGGKFVDTNKILALLLTSSLPKEILGFIWNLATNGANNKLNQQQLYITLALVALAQMGCTFNNLNVLNYMPQPPLPSFNMNLANMNSDEQLTGSDSAVKSPPTPATISPIVNSGPSNPSSTILAPNPASSLTTANPVMGTTGTTHVDDSNDDDEFGDFTDYQSAEVITIQPSLSYAVPTTLPSTAVLQPCITAKQGMSEFNHSVVTKLGGNHGRSIGSRLANYTLGAPKSRNISHKFRRSSVEHDNSYLDDEVTFNNVVREDPLRLQPLHVQPSVDIDNDDFSEFQIAAGLNVNVNELFPKCNPKVKVVLKESSIRADSGDEEVKGSQLGGELLSLDPPLSSATAVASVDPVLHISPARQSKELMSVEEDKYSALRFIEIESKPITTAIAPDNVTANEADDFGDFVSADDIFSDIPVKNKENHTSQLTFVQNVGQQTLSNQINDFHVLNWEGEVLQPPPILPQGNDSILICDAENVDDVSSALSCVEISKDVNACASKTEETSEWTSELYIGKPSSNLYVKSSVTESNVVDDDEFGDFVGPQASLPEDINGKPSSTFLSDQTWSEDGTNKLGGGLLSDNRSVSSLELPVVGISRHGSLPSLDLNIFPLTDSMSEKMCDTQVLNWIRCLESCLSIIQAAVTTFSSISSQSILIEVLDAPEGRTYLSNLLEVHLVTRRIQRSCQRSRQDCSQAECLLLSVNRLWSSMKPFYSLANIESVKEKDNTEEENSQPSCGVCGSPANCGVLEFGGQTYHAPCANLWVNCIERTLPVQSSLL